MALDRNLYPTANQPCAYKGLCAILKGWGFTPVGEHNIFDISGFLEWQHLDPDNGACLGSFVIGTPKWSTAGMAEPVWQMAGIADELARQRVFQGGDPGDLHIKAKKNDCS